MTPPAVEVLWIARYDYDPGWSLRPHDHNYFQLLCCLDGRGHFTTAAETFTIEPGHVFLIPPGHTHGLRADTLLRTLDVKFRVATGTLHRRLGLAGGCLKGNQLNIAGRLERIRSEGENGQPWYRELCGTLMAEILYLYLRADQSAAPPVAAQSTAESTIDALPPDSLLRRALAFLQAHYMQQMEVRDIAQAAGCSDRALRSHFHRAFGTGPLAYLQRYRLRQAQELMRYSDYSLKEISGKVGFQTVHHFTRLFTALENRTPAHWRRQYLTGVHKDVYIDPAFTNLNQTVAPQNNSRNT